MFDDMGKKIMMSDDFLDPLILQGVQYLLVDPYS